MEENNILPTIEGKNQNRVHEAYKKYPEDWQRQYNMLLMDNITCNSCVHCNRCVTLFDQKETSGQCQFYPNKFQSK